MRPCNLVHLPSYAWVEATTNKIESGERCLDVMLLHMSAFVHDGTAQAIVIQCGSKKRTTRPYSLSVK